MVRIAKRKIDPRQVAAKALMADRADGLFDRGVLRGARNFRRHVFRHSPRRVRAANYEGRRADAYQH